jgi:hypothetical protein
MGLDLWFRQDVARILAATWDTMRAAAEGTRPISGTTSEDRLARAYAQGFEDALRAVSVAFGLTGSGGCVPRAGDDLARGYPRGHSRWPAAGELTDLD